MPRLSTVLVATLVVSAATCIWVGYVATARGVGDGLPATVWCSAHAPTNSSVELECTTETAFLGFRRDRHGASATREDALWRALRALAAANRTRVTWSADPGAT